MIATKDFIEDKILCANRKYSTLRVTDGDEVVAKFSIEKSADRSRYRETLATTISGFIDKYGPLQYRDEHYGKNDMCLVVEGSSDKLGKLHPGLVLKCDRVAHGDVSVIFDISQHGNVCHHTPSNFTFAISKKDLKKLLDELYNKQIDDDN